MTERDASDREAKLADGRQPPTIQLTPPIATKLGFIRYIFSGAVAQAQLPEPMCFTAVLGFHDALELYLDLACSELGVWTKGMTFTQYATALEKKGRLSQSATLAKLNQTRVSLKHHGILPHRSVVDDFRTKTAAFFEENTPRIFGVNFDELSLADFIQAPTAKAHLKAAVRSRDRGDHRDALGYAAAAFDLLMAEHEERAEKAMSSRLLYFGRDFSRLRGSAAGLWSHADPELRRIASFLDEMGDAVAAVQGAVRTLTFGIDYRSYVKFKSTTPTALVDEDGRISITENYEGGLPMQEEVDFAIDFVLQVAFRLQAMDLGVKPSRGPLSLASQKRLLPAIEAEDALSYGPNPYQGEV